MTPTKRQPDTPTSVGNQAAEPKAAPWTMPRKKHMQINLDIRQHHIKSERRRIATALKGSKVSNEKNLEKANISFFIGLYRRSRK